MVAAIVTIMHLQCLLVTVLAIQEEWVTKDPLQNSLCIQSGFDSAYYFKIVSKFRSWFREVAVVVVEDS